MTLLCETKLLRRIILTIALRILLCFLTLAFNSIPLNAMCVSVKFELDLTPDQTWSVMRDLSISDKYLPGERQVDILSSNKSGVGAHRRIYRNNSVDDYVDETVVEWIEGEGFTLKLHKDETVLPPFERAEFKFTIRKTLSSRSLVVLQVLSEMPSSVSSSAPSKQALIESSERRLVQVAAGMKHYYQTGLRPTSLERERLLSDVQLLGYAC